MAHDEGGDPLVLFFETHSPVGVNSGLGAFPLNDLNSPCPLVSQQHPHALAVPFLRLEI